MRRKLFLLLILIAPLGIFFPFLGNFPYPPGSIYSDLSISHYPNAIYILRSLREWGQIPLWSDAILSGYPFAADPLSGLWYLPGWVAYLFPLPAGFNINIILHLLFGGIGTFIFLRREGKSDYASLAGALIFELFPKFSAHYAAGHLTLLYGVAWMPWLFICEKHLQGRKRLFGTGIVLGMVALADVRIFAFLMIAWIFFVLYRWWQEREASFGRFCLQRLMSAGLAFLISAPLILPLIEFTGLSSRSTLATADNLAMALPLSNLAGLIVPNIGGYAEWIIYPGGAGLIVLLFTLTVPELRKRNVFWLGLILFTFLIAVGAATPVGDWLFRLPVLNLLRVPTRAIFLTGWAFSIIAGDGIDFLVGLRGGKTMPKPPGNGLIVAAISGFLVLISLGLWILTGTVPLLFLWGTAAMLIVTVLILARRSSQLPANIFILLFIPILCLDLAGVDSLGIDFKPAAEILSEGKGAISLIQTQESGEKFRTYSPSYSLPQQTAAAARLELADGINPLQLSSYINFMEGATGIPIQGYSVTLPPFATAHPETDNQAYEPNPTFLGLLNVRYIVSAFNLNIDRLNLVGEAGGSKVYENMDTRPRAWIQADQNLLSSEFYAVDMKWSPNSIEIITNRGGWLVISEMAYPGWKAYVDGLPVELQTFNNSLRTLVVPAGEHLVKLDFQPVSVYAGIFLAGAGWLSVLVSLYLRRGKQ